MAYVVSGGLRQPVLAGQPGNVLKVVVGCERDQVVQPGDCGELRVKGWDRAAFGLSIR